MKIHPVLSLAIASSCLLGVASLPDFSLTVAQAQTTSRLQTYRAGNLYTIQFPQGWQVTGDVNYLMLTNFDLNKGGGTAPQSAIKTDIAVFPQPFDTVVQKAQKGKYTEAGDRIIKRGALKLGGRDAYRVWTTDSNFDFPDAVTTYVRYGNQTVSITSFYTMQNPSAVPTIQQIHGSFRLLR